MGPRAGPGAVAGKAAGATLILASVSGTRLMHTMPFKRIVLRHLYRIAGTIPSPVRESRTRRDEEESVDTSQPTGDPTRAKRRAIPRVGIVSYPRMAALHVHVLL